MREGWYGDDYLILFDEPESLSASERYEITQFLPGYRVIGLRGWDDFILQDSNGATYTVPTVPAITAYLEPYGLPSADQTVAPDDRFQNKNQVVREADSIRWRSSGGRQHHLA